MNYKLKAKVPSRQVARTSAEPKLNPFYGFVLLCYGFITVLTPNLNALDSNGPKFFSLAILNLFAYLIIIIGNKGNSKQNIHFIFFQTWVGMIYSLFLVVSLLSFFNAINVFESIVNFAKLFTIFSSSYSVSIILQKDKRYLKILAVAMSFLLIADSLTVFYNMTTSILAGKGPAINELQSVYSNKNILSAALFVKISFALWLLNFEKEWLKTLGFTSIFLSLIAILFMSVRAFYIGLIILTIIYFTYMGLVYYRNQERRKIWIMSGSIVATLAVVFCVFTLVQKYFYPKDLEQFNYYSDFVARLKTVLQKDQKFGYGGRTITWQRSLNLVKEHPFLGVGLGNWKIEVLKYENPTTGEFTYMYKNHNDFLENIAEIGIFGGALFIGIFIMVFANFIRAFFKARKGEERLYSWLFLPAFGLFCYSFDAFFNFPSDRPEIISLFAIFVGAGIAFSPQSNFVTRHASRVTHSFSPVTRHASRVTFIAIFIALMLGSIYIFNLNFQSLKLQLLAKQEMKNENLTSKSDLFINGFPAIPNISVEGEPIAVTKARYLIVEGKFNEAIDILKNDNSSPYDTRPEFLIAMAYLNMNQPDSTLVYAEKVHKLKPFFSENIRLMANAYNSKGNLTEALRVLNDHIKLNATNNMPVSDIIYKQQASLKPLITIQKFQKVFDDGLAAFNRKDYNNAVKYFSEIIVKEQSLADPFEYRAFCYYFLNKFQLCLVDVDRAIAIDPSKPSYYNLRGGHKTHVGR